MQKKILTHFERCASANNDFDFFRSELQNFDFWIFIQYIAWLNTGAIHRMVTASSNLYCVWKLNSKYILKLKGVFAIARKMKHMLHMVEKAQSLNKFKCKIERIRLP